MAKDVYVHEDVHKSLEITKELGFKYCILTLTLSLVNSFRL